MRAPRSSSWLIFFLVFALLGLTVGAIAVIAGSTSTAGRPGQQGECVRDLGPGEEPPGTGSPDEPVPPPGEPRPGPPPERPAGPEIGCLRLKPSAFCVSRSEDCPRPGTRIIFHLTDYAVLRGRIELLRRGREPKPVRTLMAVGDRGGPNVVRLSGAGLRRGRYRLSLVAANFDGHKGSRAFTRFEVRATR